MINKRRLTPLFLIAPSIVVLVAIAMYPFFYALHLSLHKWDLGDPTKTKTFIGILNYVKIFSNLDFWHSLLITVIYTFSVVLVEFFLGLGIALLLNRDFKGRSLVRAIVIVPLTVTPVVVGLTWRVLYNTEYGIINHYLHVLGLPMGKWIAGMSTALLSVSIVDIWQWTPFAVLILLAGLQTIPQYLYEAAQIDGASSRQLFRYITLPSLRSSILIVLLFRTIDAFKIFDNIYALTMGGPGSATETLSMHIYIQGFRNRHMGYASALSILLLFMIIIISQFYIRLTIGREDSIKKKNFIKPDLPPN